MNPRVSRSLGPGVQGDGLPDRQGRGQARRRLHAGRDPERHHRRDAGLLRADDRLRRHQDPALHLREVPRDRASAHHRDEIGGRGRWRSAAPSRNRCRRRCAALETGLCRPGRDRGAGPGRQRPAARRDPGGPGAADARPAADDRAGLPRGADARRDPGGLRLRPVVPGPDPGASSRTEAALRARRAARRSRRAARAQGRRLLGPAPGQLTGPSEDDVRAPSHARWACGRCSSGSTPAPPSSRRARPTCTAATRPASSASPTAECESRPIATGAR